jgi:hypothetical protein
MGRVSFFCLSLFCIIIVVDLLADVHRGTTTHTLRSPCGLLCLERVACPVGDLEVPPNPPARGGSLPRPDGAGSLHLGFSQEQTPMCGWLLKKGGGKSTFGRETWKNRWSVACSHYFDCRSLSGPSDGLVQLTELSHFDLFE